MTKKCVWCLRDRPDSWFVYKNMCELCAMDKQERITRTNMPPLVVNDIWEQFECNCGCVLKIKQEVDNNRIIKVTCPKCKRIINNE